MLYDCRPPSLPPKPKKRRIGRNPVIGQPKLFGGNLEEYIEVGIPLIKHACTQAHAHTHTPIHMVAADLEKSGNYVTVYWL